MSQPQSHDSAGAQVLLETRDLSVNFTVHGGEVKAVRNVSFKVYEGETLCIVGESGSGKSVTVQSLLGLLPTPPARVISGKIVFGQRDLLQISRKEMRQIAGGAIAMVFQDPLVSLNPTMTVYDQIAEVLLLHTEMDAQARRHRVLELLELVRIPEPIKRLKQFPHELSGGMRQRVMIAMALACNPKLLIADEPTTALDVTIQAQILSLIRDLAHRLNMATILITHDLGVVAKMADRVIVMYGGQVIEEGKVDDVFYQPKHPYTVGLQRAMPRDETSSHQPLTPIPGSPPDLFSPPVGCAFAPRCPAVMRICVERAPPEVHAGSTRTMCWLQHPQATEQRRAAGVYVVGGTQQQADGVQR
ncbi:MAG: ABC transporter ATP-binding protein [Deltaproteobacteria bacterium]|nr:ABC transporter ATP-binding protein [Deltaproteobacteria bacterium]